MSWLNPKNPLDALIEKAFSQNMEFEVLASANIPKIPKISEKAKKRAKKWKKITIYVIEQSKEDGDKFVKAKTVKIPKDCPCFIGVRPKKPKIFVPKSYRKMLKPYFG